MNGTSKRLIVALDGITQYEALRYAKILNGKVWGFKINDLLFEDRQVIRKLKKYGNVFADAKLYDIPNTVRNSVKRLGSLGADVITVHASGGLEMLKAAKESCEKKNKKIKIIAVTVLTSKKINNRREVLNLVKLSIKAKVDGVVCSGHELRSIKRLPGSKKMVLMVPGIRPRSPKNNRNKVNRYKDDQTRIMSGNEAIKLGADYLIVGRPITQYKNKKDILNSLKNILEG